ncbi:MAG TPA: FkbM family methyltransferase [Terriglobales bacterium]|nr:FkbM family methyltransferase [Terriglobales bacterium]
MNLVASSLRLTTALGGKQIVSRALPRLPETWTGFETVVEYRGLRFHVHTAEETGRRMYYYNEYEPAQENVFLELVQPHSLVLDMGANMGLFSLLSASRGAYVVSFEPSRLLVARFSENIALNRLSNVLLVTEAVSDSQGTISFYETRVGNCGVGRVFAFGHNERAAPSYSVRTNTVDSYVARFGMPALIKMDIEGAEWLALKGASETFKRPDAPYLLIEFHPQEIQSLGGSLDSCLALLDSYGLRRYRLVKAKSGNHHWFVFSQKELRSSQLVLDSGCSTAVK